MKQSFWPITFVKIIQHFSASDKSRSDKFSLNLIIYKIIYNHGFTPTRNYCDPSIIVVARSTASGSWAICRDKTWRWSRLDDHHSTGRNRFPRDQRCSPRSTDGDCSRKPWSIPPRRRRSWDRDTFGARKGFEPGKPRDSRKVLEPGVARCTSG